MAKLPRQVQVRVAPAIDALADEPRPAGVEKMKDRDDEYRIRVGDYQVIYEIRDQELLVKIVRLGHRGDIYR